MSAIALLLILIIMSVFFYLSDKKDIISPPFILSLVFVFSTMVVVANISKWKVELHSNTILLIIISICCFASSYTIAKKARMFFLNKKRQGNDICVQMLTIKKVYIFLIIVFMVVTGILYYYERVRLASYMGVSGKLIDIASAARHTEYYTEAGTSELVQRLMLFAKCFAYISAYVFVNNMIVKKSKSLQIIYIIPFIIYCFLMFLSGGRMPFIHNLTYLAILYGVMTYRTKGISPQLRVKIIKIVLIAFISFFIIFIYMGITSGGISSVSETLSVYIGSSINALDIFLQKKLPQEQYFGQETLIPVYSALRSLGVDISSDILRSAREFVSMNGVQTNIYTALRRYVRDYGYLGCFIIMSVIGWIYGRLYKYALSKKTGGYSVVLYASIFYPIIEMSIEERFILKLISMAEIYEIILLYLFYRYIVKTERG